MKRSEKTARLDIAHGPWRRGDWAALGLRFLAGGVLAASGIFKLLESPEDFAAAIEAYQVIPTALMMPLARILPWVELLAGWFLICGYLTRLSAGASGILSSAFFLALAWSMFKGISLVECGCFGKMGPHLEIWQAMILDIALISTAAYLTGRKRTPWSLDNWINAYHSSAFSAMENR